MCASCLKKFYSLILIQDASDACLLLCCLCLGLWGRGNRSAAGKATRGERMGSGAWPGAGTSAVTSMAFMAERASSDIGPNQPEFNLALLLLWALEAYKRERKMKEMDPICKNLWWKGKFIFISLHFECLIKQMGVNVLQFRLCVLKFSLWRLRTLWPTPS